MHKLETVVRFVALTVPSVVCCFLQDREISHHQGRGSDGPQPEYEAWRAERNRIDSDRISRQKTAEGHWRREWDNEKIIQE